MTGVAKERGREEAVFHGPAIAAAGDGGEGFCCHNGTRMLGISDMEELTTTLMPRA